MTPQTAREDANPPTANHPPRSSHHVLPPGAARADPATARWSRCAVVPVPRDDRAAGHAPGGTARRPPTPPAR
ncbi:hypothetical protein [Streptomyces sp. OP7]|uniref:hypothetical protein n=1 Tax=Streptomyces sp. OP7 TaxID=3142462 RepID=UPI0032E8D834